MCSFLDSGDYAVLTAVTHRSLLYTLCSREGKCGDRLAHIFATFGRLVTLSHDCRFQVGLARFRLIREALPASARQRSDTTAFDLQAAASYFDKVRRLWSRQALDWTIEKVRCKIQGTFLSTSKAVINELLSYYNVSQGGTQEHSASFLYTGRSSSKYALQIHANKGK